MEAKERGNLAEVAREAKVSEILDLIVIGTSEIADELSKASSEED